MQKNSRSNLPLTIYGHKLFRPLDRRWFSMARPSLVAIRFRKPCFLFRLINDGWNVLLINNIASSSRSFSPVVSNLQMPGSIPVVWVAGDMSSYPYSMNEFAGLVRSFIEPPMWHANKLIVRLLIPTLVGFTLLVIIVLDSVSMHFNITNIWHYRIVS